MKSMKKTYGKDAEAVFYASKNKGVIKGVEKKKRSIKRNRKKPKGSGRRLYTDENPRDTVGIKYATPADAKRTVSKVKKVKKPFARKIQILTVLEQRAKVQGKNKQAAIAKKGKEAIRRKRGKA